MNWMDGDVTGAPRVSQGPPSSDVAPQSTDVLGVANHCLALRAGAWAPSARKRSLTRVHRGSRPWATALWVVPELLQGVCAKVWSTSCLSVAPASGVCEMIHWMSSSVPCQNRPINPKLPSPKTIQKRKVSNGILLNETVLKVTTYKSQRYGKEHTASDLDNYRAS